jgi:HEAT repeat protein
MTYSNYKLHLVFKESGGKHPLVLESRWEGDPRLKNPTLSDVSHGRIGLRAVCILFLLAKYHAKKVHATGVKPMRLRAPYKKGHWIYTLANAFNKPGPPEWVQKNFLIEPQDIFFGAELGGSQNRFAKEPPVAIFRSDKFPLNNLYLFTKSRGRNAKLQKLSGLQLLKFAVKLQGRHWPKRAVREAAVEDPSDKGPRTNHLPVTNPFVEARQSTRICKAVEVRDFLQNLAEKGLAERMLFLPPGWQEKPLREFCIEPRLVTEAQWQQHRRKDIDAENDASFDPEPLPPTEIRKSPHGKPVLLSWVLGDKSHIPRHRRVILRGNPGEGKSTALWLHIGNQCRALIDQLDARKLLPDDSMFRVPLILPLGDKLREASLPTLAIDKSLDISFGEEGDTVQQIREWLHEKIKRGEYTLAIDALDELSSPDSGPQIWLKKQLLNIPSSVPVVIATRPNTIDTTLGLGSGQPDGQFATYYVTGFAPPRIKQYVQNYFGSHKQEKAQSLLNRLRQSPGPNQLARLPLLLAALCHIHDANDPAIPLPATRTEILSAALRCLLIRGTEKRATKFAQAPQPDPLQDQLKEVLLRRVAWKTRKTGSVPMRAADLQRELGKALTSIKLKEHEQNPWVKEPAKHHITSKLIDEFCEDGILIKMGSDGHSYYRFLLKSFHELLIAGYLASLPKHKARRIISHLIRLEPWRYNNWLSILPLAAGQSPYVAERLLTALDPIPCLFPNPDPRVSCYDSELLPGFLSALVSESRSQEGCNWARKLIALTGQRERDRAIVNALAEIGGPTAEASLFNWVLGESDKPLCARFHWELVPAFAKIASPRMTHVLIQRLNNAAENVEHRSRYAFALGHIGGSASRETLEVNLKDRSQDEELRITCAVCLGRMAENRSSEHLIAILRDDTEGKELRAYCASALGEIGGPKSRSALITFLQRPFYETASYWCACALARIGDTVSRDALIAKLKAPPDAKLDIRDCCAWALGIIGDIESRNAIIDRLGNSSHDPEGIIRGCCAHVLGRMADIESRRALIAGLQNSPDDRKRHICLECVNALREIGDSESHSALFAFMQKLDVTEQWLRDYCMSILQGIGFPFDTYRA